ncbi:sperm microtubule associated protein 2-like isoform X2 [Cinclus cinclus]|uniref:sperm microtubule associated protein 2-like isoform X2 n=1 Tax=Cinclus cinclus TaxID=127875 RepID=UPI002E10562B
MDSGKLRVTVSVEEGCWEAHPCREGARLCGLLYKLCVCTSLPHSGPMQVPTRVSSFATSANALVRVRKLTEPLIRELTCCSRHTHPSSVISMVSRSPQKAIVSTRTIELSKPKQLHANYVPLRDPEWPVTEAAKHAVATPRVLELAQPSTRSHMGLTTLNPDAFRVKETAMKAACSPRLQELARPIQR